MIKVILPNIYREITEPLIYLGGPIIGAPKWHNQAIDILSSSDSDLIAAVPKKRINPQSQIEILTGDEDHFKRNREWERYYMNEASKKGSIIFWLPKEENHNCHKPYASMSRYELGIWIARYVLDDDTRICVGAEEGFKDLDCIEFDISSDAPKLKVNRTLEETCQQAIKLACSK